VSSLRGGPDPRGRIRVEGGEEGELPIPAPHEHLAGAVAEPDLAPDVVDDARPDETARRQRRATRVPGGGREEQRGLRAGRGASRPASAKAFMGVSGVLARFVKRGVERAGRLGGKCGPSGMKTKTVARDFVMTLRRRRRRRARRDPRAGRLGSRRAPRVDLDPRRAGRIPVRIRGRPAPRARRASLRARGWASPRSSTACRRAISPQPAWAALAWSGPLRRGLRPRSMEERCRVRRSRRAVPPRLPDGRDPHRSRDARLAAVPPPVEARLLDLSPATLVEECAGIDWTRNPVIYDAAGSADIDPSLRLPLPRPACRPDRLCGGCLLAAAGEGIARARSIPFLTVSISTTTNSAPTPVPYHLSHHTPPIFSHFFTILPTALFHTCPSFLTTLISLLFLSY
jgi:hypothetical protein